MSNTIIITTIVCVTVILIVSIFCYTGYKNNENVRSNKFFKTVNENFHQYERIVKDIDNLKDLINSMQYGIEFISMQISNKENKDNKND